MSGASPLEPVHQLHDRRALSSVQQAPNPASLARMLSNAQKPGHSTKVSLRDRICCHQWNWFTMVKHLSSVTLLYRVVPPMLTPLLPDHGKPADRAAILFLFSPPFRQQAAYPMLSILVS